MESLQIKDVQKCEIQTRCRNRKVSSDVNNVSNQIINLPESFISVSEMNVGTPNVGNDRYANLVKQTNSQFMEYSTITINKNIMIKHSNDN